MSRTQWHDEDGYHTVPVSVKELYAGEEGENNYGSCGSNARLTILRKQLKKHLSKSRAILEIEIPGCLEVKPEPETVAAALLMSDKKNNQDLDDPIEPDEIVDRLFSQTSGESIGVVRAFADSINGTMVPIMGRKPPTDPMLGTMGIEIMKNRARNIAAPRSNAFQESSDDNQVSNATRDSRIDEPRPTTIIEYAIKAEPPAYRNFIQLNGSVKPSWFQGYVLVSPFVPEHIRTISDPGEVLLEGWRICRPQLFKTFSESSTTNTESSSSELNDSIYSNCFCK